MPDRLNAVDVLNCEYLREIAYDHGLAYTTDFNRALEIFAHAFIQAGNVADQNTMLTQLLSDSTFGQSTDANEETVAYLANFLRTSPILLREFAKQEGIRLRTKFG